MNDNEIMKKYKTMRYVNCPLSWLKVNPKECEVCDFYISEETDCAFDPCENCMQTNNCSSCRYNSEAFWDALKKDFANEQYFVTISIPPNPESTQQVFTIDAYKFQDGTVKSFENLSISKAIATMKETLNFSSFTESDLFAIEKKVIK